MGERLAAAPISWGICEVPGWGAQMPPDRVLAEMRDLGVRATELGAIGWLPADGATVRGMLDQYGLQMIGGFVPLVLHDSAQRGAALDAAHAAAANMATIGGTRFVTAAIASPAWDRPALTTAQWDHMLAMLGELDDLVAEYGLTQAVHPHVNTLIETADEFARFVDGCDSPFTLDTGHLFLGHADPVAIAHDHHHRVSLVHVKDVDATIAQRFWNREATLMECVMAGLFTPAGQGDVPIGDTVAELERNGYSGWYVLEQDVSLDGEMPPAGQGPVVGVRSSIDYLQSLDASARQ